MPRANLRKSPAPIPPQSTQTLEGERPKVPPFLDDGFPNPKAYDVWEYMQVLTPEQWSDHMVYVYRTKPTQIRTSGKAAYIERYAEPITVETLRKNHGGREFSIRINRRIGTQDKTIFHVSEIGVEAAPILADGEKLAPGSGGYSGGGGENPELMGTLNRLVEDTIQQRDAAVQAGREFDTSKYVKDAMDVQRLGFNASIDAMRAAAMNGGAGGGIAEKFMMLVFSKMADNFGGDPLEKMTNQITVFKALQETLAPAAPVVSTGDPWVTAITTLIPVLPTLMSQGVEISRNLAVARGVAPVESTPAVSTPAVIAPVVSAAGSARGAVFTPAEATASASEPAAGLDGSGPAIRQRVNAAIVDILLRGDSGEQAAYVCHSIAPDYAQELVGKLKADPAGLAALPEFLPVLSDPRLGEFIKAFVGCFVPEVPETSPAAAPAA